MSSFNFLLIQFVNGKLTATQLATAVSKGLITATDSAEIQGCNLTNWQTHLRDNA